MAPLIASVGQHASQPDFLLAFSFVEVIYRNQAEILNPGMNICRLEEETPEALHFAWRCQHLGAARRAATTADRGPSLGMFPFIPTVLKRHLNRGYYDPNPY